MMRLPSPEAVLDYWIGATGEDASAIAQQNQLWFEKSFATDKFIADTFVPLIAELAEGLAEYWAEQGPRERIAAIIALDQFSRNIFRSHAYSFIHDPLARRLMKDGLQRGDDKQLSETERIFYYITLEHSESAADQDLSVALFENLVEEARPDFKPICTEILGYANKHRDVIWQFGRFPHRNPILNRASTPEEQTYLAQPGAGF